MDVDDLVRRARPRGMSGWSVSREGQRVLESLKKSSVTDRAQSRWQSTVRWSIIGTGVAAAATAVTLVVPAFVATPQPATAPPAASQQAGDRSAPEILLAAATSAEKASDSGRYWRVKRILVLASRRVGASGDYELAERRVLETWDPRDAGENPWRGYRSLGTKPATEADEQKWQAAGSPTLSSSPDGGQLVQMDTPTVYLHDLGGLSVAEVQQLPDDPSRLREWVERRIQAGMRLTPGSPDGERAAFGVLCQLLLDVPAPPKVRAASFLAMSSIPGIRSLGEVKDVTGRVGLGVEYSYPGNSFYKERLIIDGTSHMVLAVEVRSGMTNGPVLKQVRTAVIAAEWSNAKPHVPTLP